MKPHIENFRSFVSEAFRDAFVPGLTAEQKKASEAYANRVRAAIAAGKDPRTVPTTGLGATMRFNTGEFTDESGVPMWSEIVNPKRRRKHGGGGINPFLSQLAYNRGDGSSVARLDRGITVDETSATGMMRRIGPMVAWANEVCGNPLSDDEVSRFVEDLRKEIRSIMSGRSEPRKITGTAATRNRINTEATDSAVAEFNRKLANAKTPDEVLDVFAPVLKFRARLERVRREIMRRKTDIAKAAFQLTEYSMLNTLRIYNTDEDAIFVEAIGVWTGSESGIGFGRDVDVKTVDAKKKRISLVFPNEMSRPENVRKAQGNAYLLSHGVTSKFDLEKTKWGGYEKAVTKGDFLGTFSKGDFWVDVRFTRRFDGTRDELDDIVDEFSPAGPDYHGKVKLLPEYREKFYEIERGVGSRDAMAEESFPTEGSAEAVDAILTVMEDSGMNVSISRKRFERGFRRENVYSMRYNTGAKRTTEMFMELLNGLAKYKLHREYGKRRVRKSDDVIDFEAAGVSQMVCMQVGYSIAADKAHDEVRKLFYGGLFNGDKSDAAEALVLTSNIASEITVSLIDVIRRRRKARHENID